MKVKIIHSKVELTPKIKKLLLLAFFILACGAAYLLGKEINPVEIETETVINLTEYERQEIINEIQENCKAEIVEQKKKYERIISSMKPEIKDSINWIDSIKYTYKDSIIYIEQPSLAINPEQLIYENIVDDTVYIQTPNGFWDDRFVGYIGLGPTYGRTDFLHNSSTSNNIYWKPNDWSWYWGIQFGIGIRVFSF